MNAPFPGLVAVCLLLPVVAAFAASMGPERLRLCVGLEIEREAIDRVRAEQSRGLAAAERRLEASGQRLQERRERLDRKNAEAVARFNQIVEEHNLLLDEVDQRTVALDASVPQQNALVQRFNDTCLAEVVSERNWQIEKLRQQDARRAASPEDGG